MPSKYCSNCQAIRSMRVSVYKREKINPDGDKIQIETTSFHCEDCNSFIDSEDVIVNVFRNAKIDRRKKMIQLLRSVIIAVQKEGQVRKEEFGSIECKKVC